MTGTDPTKTDTGQQDREEHHVTRREFLTGQWFVGDSDQDSCTSKSKEEMTGGTSFNLPPLQRAILYVLALLVVLAVTLSAAGVIGLAAADQAATAADAQRAQQQALARWTELQQLDATAEVEIRSSVKRSIRTHIQQGNLSQRNAQYEEAVTHYRTAKRQAIAALKRGYVTRAEFLLNVTGRHLAGLEQLGYQTPEIEQKQAKLETFQNRLKDVQSLSDARGLENDAVALYQSLNDLPRPEIVRWVTSLRNGLALILAALLVSLGAGIGFRAGQRRERQQAGADDKSEHADVVAGPAGYQDQQQGYDNDD